MTVQQHAHKTCSFGLDSHLSVFSTSLYSVIVIALVIHVSGLSLH